MLSSLFLFVYASVILESSVVCSFNKLASELACSASHRLCHLEMIVVQSLWSKVAAHFLPSYC